MGQKPKIVCVDDEKTVLEVLKRVLSENFEVLTAESSKQAIDLIKKNPDTAILLADLHMPGDNGMELLQKAKTLAPTTVRAILSGQVDLKDMMTAVNQAEIDRFVLKPFENEYLELQMLEALQRHILLSERKQLQHLAITDVVTGLKNHRYFQETLRKEVDRAQRHDRPLSLIMADLDHFKDYNDKYGHPAGDKALSDVARELLNGVRLVDTVARYGGEEFAIVLPDTDAQNAQEVAERLRKSISSMTRDEGPALSISLGISSLKKDESATSLLEHADKALYESKSKGRNCSTFAE